MGFMRSTQVYKGSATTGPHDVMIQQPETLDPTLNTRSTMLQPQPQALQGTPRILLDSLDDLLA